MIFHSKAGQKCVRFCRLRNFLVEFLMSKNRQKKWSESNKLMTWIAKNCPKYLMTEGQVKRWCDEVE